MARDPIDTTEAIAELSGLLVSHQNMQDVVLEVVNVLLYGVPGGASPQSISWANDLAPPAVTKPLAVESDDARSEQ